MKQKIILCALGLTAMLLGGCVAQQQAQVEQIGEEQAKQTALADAGLTGQSVPFTQSALKSRDGVDYYAVAFTAGGQELTYNIDALTGTVINKQSIALPLVSTGIDAAQPTGGNATDTVGSTAQSTASPAPVPAVGGAVDVISSATRNDEASATGTASIPAEQAKAKALEHAGTAADKVTFVQAKLDYDDGKLVYDVEFYTGTKEYDYEIDANTGAVISYDFDADHYTAPEASAGTVAITADRAKEIALSQVAGATTADIYEFETDYDDGRLAYEGKIIYNGREYEFEIDGYSGGIRSWESEPVSR